MRNILPGSVFFPKKVLLLLPVIKHVGWFRFEGLELARERDNRAMEAWGEHPYIDVVDNRADFETKVKQTIF